jgi:hypothetical protein
VHIIEALGGTAAGAYKVYMVIVVVAVGAAAAAKGVAGSPIATGYAVDNTFFSKSLQGAVNGDAVHALQRVLNIGMAQSAGLLQQKQLQNGAAAIRHAQVVSL